MIHAAIITIILFAACIGMAAAGSFLAACILDGPRTAWRAIADYFRRERP